MVSAGGGIAELLFVGPEEGGVVAEAALGADGACLSSQEDLLPGQIQPPFLYQPLGLPDAQSGEIIDHGVWQTPCAVCRFAKFYR